MYSSHHTLLALPLDTELTLIVIPSYYEINVRPE
jgi:hypothetical protein